MRALVQCSLPRIARTRRRMRRAEVIDEAFSQPVSVRDDKTGDLLLMVPQALINRSNEVARYKQLFTRVVVERQRPDPSSVALDQASSIVDFTPAQRQQCVREFAEALSTSMTEDDPTAMEAFIAYMSHANDPVLDGERVMLDRHLSPSPSAP